MILIHKRMLEIKVAEYIVTDALVPLESQLARQVEPTSLQIANDARTAQILLLLQFFSSGNSEAIDYYSQDKSNHHLVYDDYIDILK